MNRCVKGTSYRKGCNNLPGRVNNQSVITMLHGDDGLNIFGWSAFLRSSLACFFKGSSRLPLPTPSLLSSAQHGACVLPTLEC
jgi:hypothetical protein